MNTIPSLVNQPPSAQRLRMRGTSSASASKADELLSAARILKNHYAAGRPLTACEIRLAMVEAFGDTDARGAWSWKDAYEACEAALILHLLDSTNASALQDPARLLAILSELAALEPSHTRRSVDQMRLQQFSTPIEIAFCVFCAAHLKAGDNILEPSAGTGMLAVFPLIHGGIGTRSNLYLNEISETRRELLSGLFPSAQVSAHNAESIADHLLNLVPDVVVMNPPFSIRPQTNKRAIGADLDHLRSAFSMLPPSGRLVAITSTNCRPDTTAWHRKFETLGPSTILFSAELDGGLYSRRGTRFPTRLTVLDRCDRSSEYQHPQRSFSSAQALLTAIQDEIPERHQPTIAPAAETDLFGQDLAAIAPQPAPRAGARKTQQRQPAPQSTAPGLAIGNVSSTNADFANVSPLTYNSVEPEPVDPTVSAHVDWAPTVVDAPGATPHPTTLIQSSAMAAVRYPVPSHQPMLPRSLVTTAALSDAQLESVVLAGDAHQTLFAAKHRISADWDTVIPCTGNHDPDEPIEYDGKPYSPGFHFRKGWMLGDGTGAGKGRQVAAILLDNWLNGRKRAIWLSQSDKLLEDARRDWTALGGRETDVFPLSRFAQDIDIPFEQGILFCTYATLRSAAKKDKQSRVHQIVKWLAGSDDFPYRTAFEGVIIFDESHAMANAAGGSSNRGPKTPSQQGLAGLRLQQALPMARVCYVSATGATELSGLSYAFRLGLWDSGLTPFATRNDFLAAMDAGGVAALEVVSRDLKALGLYQSRALSYAGVEVDILEHQLTPDQRQNFDAWADAFQMIHANLQAALEATKVSDGGKTLNKNTKSSAMSLFESTKQRFFAHILNAMKCPTLIRAIENDIDDGHAVVIQLVSTGQALMERQLATIPVSEWNDIQVDLTPRDNIIEYLKYAFPTQLYEIHTDDNGKECSKPVFDTDGNPVQSREAIAYRDQLILKLATLPSTPTALDQIIHHFGHENVAEVTGRDRRIVRIDDEEGTRFALRGRPASSNLSEANDFMADKKRILVFSQAGGTGRSYHSDLGCGNTRRRIHYLLEPGWRADQAIQGLGRTHRTNQASAPLFRPVTTDVKGERRFTATIAKRLDSMGAITRGQRNSQTAMDGDQSLFREEDNFESRYALAALRQFYSALYLALVPEWSLSRLEELTGLSLLDGSGNLKQTLPPMTQFLNRILALRIDSQNSIFSELETRIDANIAQAIEHGTFETGVETLRADSFSITNTETLKTYGTGETTLVELLQRDVLRPTPADEAREIASRSPAAPGFPKLVINKRSGFAAVVASARSLVDDNGRIIPRLRLIRPADTQAVSISEFTHSNWVKANEETWTEAWNKQTDDLPPHHEKRLFMVCGMLLPIWQSLPDSNMRVRKLTTDDGQSLIGRVLTPQQSDKLRLTFGLSSEHSLTTQETFDAILQDNARYTLVNDWKLSRRMLAGQYRIDIFGPNPEHLDYLDRIGVAHEIIAYRARFFCPDVSVLETLLRSHPIQSST